MTRGRNRKRGSGGSVGSADAGERSKPQQLKRPPSRESYRAIFGHNHDDVPPWIDNRRRRETSTDTRRVSRCCMVPRGFSHGPAPHPPRSYYRGEGSR
jgi:hypothetical protein